MHSLPWKILRKQALQYNHLSFGSSISSYYTLPSRILNLYYTFLYTHHMDLNSHKTGFPLLHFYHILQRNLPSDSH